MTEPNERYLAAVQALFSLSDEACMALWKALNNGEDVDYPHMDNGITRAEMIEILYHEIHSRERAKA